MPVIEYKFNIGEDGRLVIPGYVEDRGHWYNPADHTYLGWVKDEADREYWVPDTIIAKTKAECVARTIGMMPIMQLDSDGTEVAMDSAEVTTMMENWYDAMDSNNS